MVDLENCLPVCSQTMVHMVPERTFFPGYFFTFDDFFLVMFLIKFVLCTVECQHILQNSFRFQVRFCMFSPLDSLWNFLPGNFKHIWFRLIRLHRSKRNQRPEWVFCLFVLFFIIKVRLVHDFFLLNSSKNSSNLHFYNKFTVVLTIFFIFSSPILASSLN